MLNRNMSLEERLCRDIESAWQGIVYDGALKISHEVDATTTCESCTIYEAGSQKRIAFDVDSYDEKAAGNVRNAIAIIKRKFPDCSKYNFTVGEVEDGIQRKILLTLE